MKTCKVCGTETDSNVQMCRRGTDLCCEICESKQQEAEEWCPEMAKHSMVDNCAHCGWHNDQ